MRPDAPPPQGYWWIDRDLFAELRAVGTTQFQTPPRHVRAVTVRFSAW